MLSEYIRCFEADLKYMLEMKDYVENQDHNWWARKLDTSSMQVNFKDTFEQFNAKILQNSN